MLFVGTSIIHPSTEGVFLLCNILDLLIYSFYIAEAFEILDEKKLSCCINEVKEAKRTGKSWKEIIRKYLPWEKVETKLINRDIN